MCDAFKRSISFDRNIRSALANLHHLSIIPSKPTTHHTSIYNNTHLYPNETLLPPDDRRQSFLINNDSALVLTHLCPALLSVRSPTDTFRPLMMPFVSIRQLLPIATNLPTPFFPSVPTCTSRAELSPTHQNTQDQLALTFHAPGSGIHHLLDQYLAWH